MMDKVITLIITERTIKHEVNASYLLLKESVYKMQPILVYCMY